MIALISTIVVLGCLIFFHEFGHFIVARLMGVGVLRFSLGYPPTMVKIKRGETEYCLSWIPFGGYVKFKGEITGERDKIVPRDHLNGRSPWVKFLIASAGPFANLLLGVLFFSAVAFFYGAGEAKDSPVVGAISPDMPAKRAGLMVGDSIISINGDTVRSWNELAQIVHKLPDTTISVVWVHNDSVLSDTIRTVARTVPGIDHPVGLMGIAPSSDIRRLPPLKALYFGVSRTVYVLYEMTFFLGRLFIGRMNWSDVGGPVLIAKYAGESAKLGIWNLVFFMGFISINLVFLNLIPLPILDGGQMLLSAMEGVRRKPIAPRTATLLQTASAALLFALMILVTVHDILRFFE